MELTTKQQNPPKKQLKYAYYLDNQVIRHEA